MSSSVALAAFLTWNRMQCYKDRRCLKGSVQKTSIMWFLGLSSHPLYFPDVAWTGQLDNVFSCSARSLFFIVHWNNGSMLWYIRQERVRVKQPNTLWQQSDYGRFYCIMGILDQLVNKSSTIWALSICWTIWKHSPILCWDWAWITSSFIFKGDHDFAWIIFCWS